MGVGSNGTTGKEKEEEGKEEDVLPSALLSSPHWKIAR